MERKRTKIRILGMMSGTSGDGIDGVMAEFDAAGRTQLVWHDSFDFSSEHFNRIQTLMKSADSAAITLGHSYIAELYALACEKFFLKRQQRPDYIAAHGQTVFHQPQPVIWDNIPLTGSLQLLDGSWLAERTGIPVICNFRSADMAVKGQGAPLVPFADLFLMGGLAKSNLAVVNIGGMANITCISRDRNNSPYIKSAFDTGPGNVLMDLFLQEKKKGRFDAGGRLAAAGQFCEKAVEEFLKDSYFARKPPKSTGREYFNSDRIRQVIQLMPSEHSDNDVLATLLEITVRSIIDSIVSELGENGELEITVAGGGALNDELMRRLAARTEKIALVSTTEKFGVPVMAREAFAFAVLGYCYLIRRPSNVVSSTGAKKEVVLGQLHPVPSDFSSRILSD